MIAPIWAFLAALKAGDTFARVGAIMAIGLTLFGLAIWQVERIRNQGVMKERARTETIQKERQDAAKRELDRLLGGDDSRVRGFDRD